MSSPPIKTGAGPRNVTSSKYVLTSAQAKNVDSRPPYPNSADDNGASDVDISHQEVGDDLGDGGHLAEINEEEEGEMSREMLIAMAELTFDWLKPPEKKKKKKKKRRRKKKGADSSASKSPTRRGSYGGRSVSASRSPSRYGRPTPGADRHKQLMKSNMRASKKSSQSPSRGRSRERRGGRGASSVSRSASRSMSRGGRGSSKDGKKKKKRKKKKKKKEPVNPFAVKFDAWLAANTLFLEEGNLVNALQLTLRVFEQTFKIEPTQLADLLHRKVFEKDQVIAELQEALKEEARKVFETKRMALDYRTEMKKAVKKLKDFEVMKSSAVRNMQLAEREKKAAVKEAKRLSDISEDLKDQLKDMTHDRDKALRKIERREKAMSKLNEKLSKVIGEKAIIEQRKGRESDVLRRTVYRNGQLEAKVLEMEAEKKQMKIDFEKEIEEMVISSNASALQYKRQVDKANQDIADYRVQVHEWQVKELSKMPSSIDNAVKKIANHAAQFLEKINAEVGQDPRNETTDEYRRRWQAIRFQIMEMRDMAWGMLDAAKLKALVRTKKEHDLEGVVSEWKLKAQASSAELARERVYTKMLRRVFKPDKNGRMRCKLRVSGTKSSVVWKPLDKNRNWNVNTGSEFTLTCCKWCGEMFIEEDSVWPTQCEIGGGDHEVLEEMVDPTML